MKTLSQDINKVIMSSTEVSVIYHCFLVSPDCHSLCPVFNRKEWKHIFEGGGELFVVVQETFDGYFVLHPLSHLMMHFVALTFSY